MMAERAARSQLVDERETLPGPLVNGSGLPRTFERLQEGPVLLDGRAPPASDAAQWLAWLSLSGVGNRAVQALLGSQPGTATADAPSTGGRPLDPSARVEMEAHLGADLTRVRVHTDPAASASAAALGARAYTVGHDVVFGPGEYRPADPAGRALLAHELTHVVQQARGGATQVGSERPEREATASAAGLMAGHGPPPIIVGSATGIARQPKAEATPVQTQTQPDDTLSTTEDAIVELLTRQALGTGLQQRMGTAALRGFIAELRRQLKAHDPVAKFTSTIRELMEPKNSAAFIGGEVVGLVAGLVSPVTDLLGLGALAEQLPLIAKNFAERARRSGAELVQEAKQLALSFAEFMITAQTTMTDLLKHPEKLSELLEGGRAGAVQAAGEAGRALARQLVGLFTGKDEGEAKPAEKESWKQALTKVTAEELSGPLSIITSKATRLRKALLSGTWSSLGYEVGHAIGTIVSNLLLLVFSEGIGNAITGIAKWLGELAPMLGRGAEVLAAVGRTIEVVEEFIAQAITKGLKLLKPIEAIASPFLKLMERLRGFLRRLAGVAEHEASTVAGHVGAELAEKQVGPKVAAVPAPPASGGAPIVKEAGGAPAVTAASAPGGKAAVEKAAAGPTTSQGLKPPEVVPPTAPKVAAEAPQPAGKVLPLKGASKPPAATVASPDAPRAMAGRGGVKPPPAGKARVGEGPKASGPPTRVAETPKRPRSGSAGPREESTTVASEVQAAGEGHLTAKTTPVAKGSPESLGESAGGPSTAEVPGMKGPSDPYASMSTEQLEKLAKRDKEAALALKARYEREWADKQAQELYKLGYGKEGNKRMAHDAAAEVRDRQGRVRWSDKELRSGGVTPEQKATLKPLEASQATHTERKAIDAARLEPGETLRITGQYHPCRECREAMRLASEGGRTVDYWWQGGHFRAVDGKIVINVVHPNVVYPKP
jgi:hypothetical protein